MPQRDLRRLYNNSGESKKPEEVFIEGKVPEWLNGTYLKVGPGKYHFDEFSMRHFIDGYSSVAKFEIKNGSKVIFQKKYLETDVLKRANAAQKPVVCEYGTPPQQDPNKGFLSRCIPTLIPEMSDNHNMAMYNLGTNLCVAGESCFFREFDYKTLQLGTKFDTNKCYGLNFTCPHPITDETGTTYTIGSSFITGLKYNFVKIPPMTGKPSTKEVLKKAKIFATISSQVTSMLSMHHSFGITKNYVVFIEQPYVLNVTKILGGVLTKGQCFFDWLEWRPELRNKFYLIEKETGKVLKTEVVSQEPFMFLHMSNCYEEDNQVVVDLVRFDNGDFFDANFIQKILSDRHQMESEFASVERFVIPLVDNVSSLQEGKELVSLGYTTASAVRKGKQIILSPEIFSKKGLELPFVNKTFLGKKYRYVYATGNTAPPGFYENTLVKIDLETKITKTWQGGPCSFPGEPYFIPNPNANEDDEDAGVVMCAVLDTGKDSNDHLLFLDAKTFQVIGKATFKDNIPFVIHGTFIPSS
ncbi:Beta,beta-carotene 9',10'-oxygenase [Orchesella cincta]|uniref:Beta,beta-carotene 9',10'-oxygenase n=1 Tax=Orchesella cincta TaxID=48709 RepID=A0A1D2N5Y4_ORCCI|nr:Beta,beta-carotene 9',10'-oxygenase [Orchesella cincta]